jgi:hypothetical protein
MFFAQEALSKRGEGVSTKDAIRDASARWRAMSEGEKLPFDRKAAEDKVRYMRDMQAHQQSLEAVEMEARA